MLIALLDWPEGICFRQLFVVVVISYVLLFMRYAACSGSRIRYSWNRKYFSDFPGIEQEVTCNLLLARN